MPPWIISNAAELAGKETQRRFHGSAGERDWARGQPAVFQLSANDLSCCTRQKSSYHHVSAIMKFSVAPHAEQLQNSYLTGTRGKVLKKLSCAKKIRAYAFPAGEVRASMPTSRLKNVAQRSVQPAASLISE
jgi:hypothetical protein